ncbi:YSC84-related protein [Allomuricauda sp. F6463D]|uniref:lipid-binding SYLF domain-containing protein n=1 Tax=Allomuricauda sp. F6463D TaxID=2926409 RepID=UPI001FF47285|nr:lipid-binding SYLF domain-containing protein [Muricauda sp. F6463D]MCK0159160.1 lipid-binding SYLF domain-containing protein [Muricauda sp. F6463D]
MKNLKFITVVATLFMVVGTMAQNNKDRDVIEDAKKAKMKLIQEDKGLQEFFENSTGYVIFPNVGEGGFILGGASGNGVVYENGQQIGMADMKKIDVGLQAGGQALTEVIFFETEEAINDFKTGDYAVSADLSAVIVESGASENINYNDGVVVFAMPKAGLMADASVGGQRFEYVPFK